MLKSEKITIPVSYRNVSHYLKLSYDAKINQDLEIYVKDLPAVSHVKIDVICEICKIEKKFGSPIRQLARSNTRSVKALLI